METQGPPLGAWLAFFAQASSHSLQIQWSSNYGDLDRISATKDFSSQLAGEPVQPGEFTAATAGTVGISPGAKDPLLLGPDVEVKEPA